MNKRIVSSLAVIPFCVAVVIAAGHLTGCEEVNGLSGLTVTPSSVVMTEDINSVVFTVVNTASNTLALPLVWSVRNPALGYIAESSGYSAIYWRTSANGDTIVVAQDQFGNEGYATVSQTAGEGSELSVSATQADTNTWTVTVSGGTAPYEWWVHDPTVGNINSEGNGESAVYESSQAGANEVSVRDDTGALGSITITSE